MSGVHVCVKKYVRLRSVGSPGSNIELGPVKAYVLDDLPFSVDVVLDLDVLLRQGFTIKLKDGIHQVLFPGEQSEDIKFVHSTLCLCQC